MFILDILQLLIITNHSSVGFFFSFLTIYRTRVPVTNYFLIAQVHIIVVTASMNEYMNLKTIASGRESKIWEMHAKALPRRQTTRVYNVGRSFKISVCFSGKKSVQPAS